MARRIIKGTVHIDEFARNYSDIARIFKEKAIF
jgi:hypothetical protein